MIPTSPGRVRRAALASVWCALAVVGAVGCGGDPDAGTNGVGRLPAEQIQSRARQAAAGVDAVRLAGTVVAGGHTYKLDMRLKSEAGSGSVTADGASFQLLRVGEQLYLKAGADFWSRADGKGGDGGSADSAIGEKLDGKYVKVPRKDPAYQRFSGFTRKEVLLDGLLTLHGPLSADGHHEQHGVRVIRITGDHGSGGTLDVSLEGKPYPLRLVRAGGAGTLAFSDWGKDFRVEEPASGDTVDYGKQLPTS
ncbi:hypothetical protein ACL02U_21625 [Streptomyces sp. MS06]|uniref:hypothetical protein n=1 Tax=Streptomyces sp. MS06 TaxID=3385974 RepID=UPI0039A2F9C0